MKKCQKDWNFLNLMTDLKNYKKRLRELNQKEVLTKNEVRFKYIFTKKIKNLTLYQHDYKKLNPELYKCNVKYIQ